MTHAETIKEMLAHRFLLSDCQLRLAMYVHVQLRGRIYMAMSSLEDLVNHQVAVSILGVYDDTL